MKTRLFSIFLMLSMFSILYPLSSFAQNYPQWHLPEGASIRLGKGPINEITYSPDSTVLAVASSIGVWLYDAHTGKELHLLPGGTSEVLSISFSPDGKTLAIPNDREIYLWDVKTGVHKHTLIGHRGRVSKALFSPDGKTLASADWAEIHLWAVETGRHKHTLTEHTQLVQSMAFSPDGKTLITTSFDNTIRLWDAVTGEHKHTLTEHTQQIANVSFSPDGKTFISVSFDSTIQLWDAHTLDHKQTLTFTHLSGRVSFVIMNISSFSPDGKTLAILNGKEVQLWDVQTGNLKLTFAADRNFDCVAFSPDGTTLAAGSSGKIRLWEARTGTLKRTLEWRTEFGFRSGIFTPSDVDSISFSPDGNTLAAASSTEIRVWNVETGVEKHTITGHTESVFRTSFSPDGNTLVVPYSGTPDRAWDVKTGTEKPVHTAPRRGMLSPDGNILASLNRNEIHLRDAATEELVHTLTGYTEPVRSMAFSPDGNTLASGSDDQTIRLWDIETGQLKREFTAHTAGVNSVAFSPDGKILASGGGWTDKIIRLWDAETGNPIRELTGHTGDYITVAFHPDRKILASGSRDKTIRLWNTETGETIRELTGHTAAVNDVAFSPERSTLASGSRDGTVLLWELTPSLLEPEKPEKIAEDVNGDGSVNIQDLVLVAANLGQGGQNTADVNGDGVVNIQDLVQVAGALGNAAASPSLNPQALSTLTTADVKQWLTQARQLNLTDTTSQKGILFLEQLLAALTPKETALLANYPNPFNPETWIPYHLAKDTDVTLTIYAIDGQVVRTLALGHQPAGMYQSRSRAAYWDGRNAFGEPVASGVYFYTLTAGNFTATRKMLIRK